MELISVIIPCYNHAHFLSETVASVLKSDYAAIEIIIVDDGSIDNTREVGEGLAKAYANVAYYYQDNAGPSVARNHGISKSKGKYLLPLDADDLIAPQYIPAAVDVLAANEGVKVVYADARKFGAVDKLWKLKAYSPRRLAQDNMIYVSAIYRKSDWERVGGYTENKVLVREDWEFWIKLLKAGGDVVKLPFVGFYYRIHDNSRRKSMNKELKKGEVAYLNEHHASFFREQLNGPLRTSRSWSRLINFFCPKGN